MKKMLAFALALLMSVQIFASINTISYQAVVHDSKGLPMPNQEVGLKFQIFGGDLILFTEEGKATTSEAGVLSYEIGTNSSKDLTSLNWFSSNLTLEVSMDLNGGTNYGSTVVSSISAVPMAMVAKTSLETPQIFDYIYQLEDTVAAATELTEALSEQTGALETGYDELKTQQSQLLEMQQKLEQTQMALAEAQQELEAMQKELAEKVSRLENNGSDNPSEKPGDETDAPDNGNGDSNETDDDFQQKVTARIDFLEEMLQSIMTRVDGISEQVDANTARIAELMGE